MTYRYFAYGSNLDPEHFAAWCREHEYEGLALEGGQAAVLDDYELRLAVPSKYWMGSVGTLEPRIGAQVYGALFEVPDEHADKIRHKEGVATGLYQEIDVEVHLWTPGDADVTIQLLPARAFIAAEGRVAPSPPPPSERWLDTVARGAAAQGLPATWIEELRGKRK